MWLFALFLAIPLVEIALFITVGGLIGLWPTLGIVVLTAVIGTFLVRREGARALADLRGAMERLGDPSEPLAHGAAILFAGALLLTPGFFTDAIGFLLLIPPVRAALFGWLRRRITVQDFRYGTRPAAPDDPFDPHPRRDPGVIDGDWQDAEDPPQRPTHRPSGWTRH
jgi:UPF0716 protein FxsA